MTTVRRRLAEKLAPHRLFLTAGLAVLIVSNLTNLLNYLAQIWLGRILSPEAFGEYNAVNGLVFTGASIFGTLAYFVARRYLELRPQQQRSFFRALFFRVGAVAVIVTIAGLALTPVITRALSLEHPLIWLYAVPMLGLLLLQPLANGLLQGMRRYVLNSTLGAAQVAVRLILIAVLVLAGSSGGAGAMAALTIAVYLVTSVAFFFTRSGWLGPITRRTWSWSELFPLLPLGTLYLLIAIIAGLDVAVAKTCLPAREAGIYAGAAVVARIAFFLPAALVTALYPEMIAVRRRSRGSALIGLALTVLISGSFVTVLELFPAQLLTLFFGPSFAAAAPILRLLGPAMGLAAIINVCGHILAARSHWWFLAPSLLLSLVALFLPRFVGIHDGCGVALVWLALNGALALVGVTALYFSAGPGILRRSPR